MLAFGSTATYVSLAWSFEALTFDCFGTWFLVGLPFFITGPPLLWACISLVFGNGSGREYVRVVVWGAHAHPLPVFESSFEATVTKSLHEEQPATKVH